VQREHEQKEREGERGRKKYQRADTGRREERKTRRTFIPSRSALVLSTHSVTEADAAGH